MSNIVTEADITGPVCMSLRQALKMSQADFWGAVGLPQSYGSRYELGKHVPGRTTRILVYVVYVAGVKIDASSEAGVIELYRLAELQRADQAARSERETSNG